MGGFAPSSFSSTFGQEPSLIERATTEIFAPQRRTLELARERAITEEARFRAARSHPLVTRLSNMVEAFAKASDPATRRNLEEQALLAFEDAVRRAPNLDVLEAIEEQFDIFEGERAGFPLGPAVSATDIIQRALGQPSKKAKEEGRREEGRKIEVDFSDILSRPSSPTAPPPTPVPTPSLPPTQPPFAAGRGGAPTTPEEQRFTPEGIPLDIATVEGEPIPPTPAQKLTPEEVQRMPIEVGPRIPPPSPPPVQVAIGAVPTAAALARGTALERINTAARTLTSLAEAARAAKSPTEAVQNLGTLMTAARQLDDLLRGEELTPEEEKALGAMLEPIGEAIEAMRRASGLDKIISAVEADELPDQLASAVISAAERKIVEAKGLINPETAVDDAIREIGGGLALVSPRAQDVLFANRSRLVEETKKRTEEVARRRAEQEAEATRLRTEASIQAFGGLEALRSAAETPGVGATQRAISIFNTRLIDQLDPTASIQAIPITEEMGNELAFIAQKLSVIQRTIVNVPANKRLADALFEHIARGEEDPAQRAIASLVDVVRQIDPTVASTFNNRLIWLKGKIEDILRARKAGLAIKDEGEIRATLSDLPFKLDAYLLDKALNFGLPLIIPPSPIPPPFTGTPSEVSPITVPGISR